jgi:hypothetical protein
MAPLEDLAPPGSVRCYHHSMKARLIGSALAVVVSLAIAWLVLVLVVRPSNERDWERDQERLATAEIDGDRVTIRNIRNVVTTSPRGASRRVPPFCFPATPTALPSTWD